MYRRHTARYFHYPKYRFKKDLIKFSRASNERLIETELMYLHKAYPKYTTYDHTQGKSNLVPYNNILVQNNLEKDHLYIGLGEKYTYGHVFLDEDEKSQFLYYLSIIGIKSPYNIRTVETTQARKQASVL